MTYLKSIPPEGQDVIAKTKDVAFVINLSDTLISPES